MVDWIKMRHYRCFLTITQITHTDTHTHTCHLRHTLTTSAVGVFDIIIRNRKSLSSRWTPVLMKRILYACGRFLNRKYIKIYALGQSIKTLYYAFVSYLNASFNTFWKIRNLFLNVIIEYIRQFSIIFFNICIYSKCSYMMLWNVDINFLCDSIIVILK